MSGSWGAGASRADADAVADWLAQTAAALAPYTNGQAYQNYIDPTLADWQRAYYGSNLPRLRSIKRAYDPDDLSSASPSRSRPRASTQPRRLVIAPPHVTRDPRKKRTRAARRLERAARARNS
jgi:hypothetical protein